MKRAERELVLTSEPAVMDAGVLWAGLDRGELRRQHAAGELQELEFEAVVFRTQYPNWNYVRFRDEEMEAFAASFAGVPFLRNHDMQDIAARDGIVTACWMDGSEMHARVRLTTEEGIRDFLAGRIDRFSISWFKRGETLCSICGKDFFTHECPHVPGRVYVVNGQEQPCEMVQLEPLVTDKSLVDRLAKANGDVNRTLADVMLDMREQDVERLHALISRHAHYTNSAKAQAILKDFAAYLPKFKKVMPVEYKRALADLAKATAAAASASVPRAKQ